MIRAGVGHRHRGPPKLTHICDKLNYLRTYDISSASHSGNYERVCLLFQSKRIKRKAADFFRMLVTTRLHIPED
jgi:hypothetical protein